MKALGQTLVMVVVLTQAHLVRADVVVAPGALATTEGSISNFYPFGIDITDPSVNQNPLISQRYQQAYASSLFSAYSVPVDITRIAFRPDSVWGGAFSATLSDVQISLSTTFPTMGELSNVFANNVGSDEAIIVDGPLTLSSAFTGSAGGPMDFDIIIDLTTPFTYDPSLGNLLLDVRNYAGVAGDAPSVMVFDAEWMDEDIYRLYTTNPDVDGVGLPTATSGPAAMGLVTQFTFTPSSTGPEPIPAPGAALLVAIGLACSGWRSRRRRA